ncbi:hypothetical protein ACX1DX_03585 [Tessaracoccus sp. Y36]|uniref:Serine/arginine repetitive matrix protein 2 n=2 Tax=Microbacterium ginsengisoli TaxID=400772 RepID=A0A0F0LUP0_9MICO|nr:MULTISPECIES: hypothetical protein [Actinomycetes]KJL36429.1 hypothetical protein RR49_01765 [Microbacterium ginsengisoli]MDI9960443.1 hypothetical protein [Rhodococcus sp. IEGM 1237]MDI9966305.1 hypothetical protein [Rhodococcus sp. IEGM 1251]MDV8128641.1 hypothetical protein [Rhodococcus sp. IEGM 1304]MEE1622463.1 hypothetical protein [Zafaria sp. J156]
MTTRTATAMPDRPEDFRTGEGLRTLLVRLHEAGPGAWEHDPVVAELMAYAAEKYAPLASKHGLDPWEAASAAFDVMRTRAARTAENPWGVITHAVRITCIFEERAQGLLCSVHQARRPHISSFHDPERFSDRENPLTDYHPAFRIIDSIELGKYAPTGEEESDSATQLAMSAAEDAIAFLAMLGWTPETARSGVEHVCGALIKAGSRATAFEALRRDKQVRVLLDIPSGSWHALLRAMLGNPDTDHATTGAGRGVLLRLLIGETIPLLLRDDDLVLALSLAAPGARE